MNRQHGSFLHLGFAIALSGFGAVGCHDAEAPEARAAPTALARSAEGCLEFQGFPHCPLGNATLTAGKDGSSLAISALRAAENDGVAILLPDVTEFTPTGRVGGGDGSRQISRSISDGVSTSSLTVEKNDQGYLVSATFTGAGESSTYDVKLYAGGERVGTISDVASGDGVMLRAGGCPPGSVGWWPFCFRVPPPPFRIMPDGACQWGMNLGAGQQVIATLADGTEVAADRVEFEEIVPASGSYPYLTFDRIDYTSDGGSIEIDSERIR